MNDGDVAADPIRLRTMETHAREEASALGMRSGPGL